jgi:hypothetical protein
VGSIYAFRFETVSECDAAFQAGVTLDHLPSDSTELHDAIARAADAVRKAAS